MKKYFIPLVCALVTFATLTVEAQNQTGFGFGSKGSDAIEGSQQGLAPHTAQAVITGTVKKTYAGLVINTVDGQYILYGEDLASMVGKKVTVTGRVSQLRGRNRIFVISFKEVK